MMDVKSEDDQGKDGHQLEGDSVKDPPTNHFVFNSSTYSNRLMSRSRFTSM